MRVLILPILFLFLFSCTNSAIKKNAGTDKHSIPRDTSTAVKDSVYRLGNFLFTGPANMKFDYFKNGSPPSKFISKGDTLYHDNEYTILGNIKELGGMGVYKKVTLKSKFSDYKVTGLYKGKPAPPDLKSDPNARTWRTMLRQGCKGNDVNFAGHYTIVQWGCGLMCTQIGVVDRVNGHVYLDFPFQQEDGPYGVDFEEDSKMLIVNATLLGDYEGYQATFPSLNPEVFVWTGNNFKRVE